MEGKQEKKQNTNISENIIHGYKLLHKYFFKYAIFFITIIIGFFVFQGILNGNATHTQINQENFAFTLQQRELILNFNKQMRQNIDDENMHIDIIQGYINNEGDYIESMNNLGSYKGYILPRFFSIHKTLPLQDISYFSESTYNPKELDTFIQNILLAKRENNEKQSPNIQLPLKETIINTFDLSCIQQKKFYQKICNTHIEDFLESFFVYALRQDYEGLKNVFNEIIKKEQYIPQLCEGMEKYIIYANDTNTEIEELFSKCDSQSFENFKKLASFIEIQKQLEKKQITKTAYNNNDINAYKITSVQQMIYKDILNNRSNLTNILEYLEFLKELLKIDRIENFYKDLSYRFNNKYIVPRIENPNNPIIKNKKYEVDNIKRQITIIDNGNELLGFEGLLYQLTNQNLLPAQSTTLQENDEDKQQRKLETLLKNISYLKIKDQIFSGSDIFINGDFIIMISPTPRKTEIKKIAAIFKLNYTKNTFLVEQIKILEQNRLNAIIKKLLTERTYSLNEMYEYIEQNLPFYGQDITTDTTNLLCEKLREQLSKRSNTEVNNCIKDTLTVTKRRTNKEYINYQINFDEYQITNIVISDKDIQSEINKKISQIQINEFNFIDVIDSIVYYTAESKDIQSEGSENIIIVTEKVKNYLGIHIDDIAEKDGKILIEFSVGGIRFIGNYSINEHIIYPIYFKEVLINNIPAKIIDFSLSLDDENKTHIYKFISAPLEQLKTISPQSYMLYQEFISETR